MDSKIVLKLEKLSKDRDSFEALKKMFGDLEKDKYRLELLEKAIQNDYDAIMITGIELDEPGPKIKYVNKGFTKITGYSRNEVIGKTPRILQGPKTDREVLVRLKERLKKGRSFFGKTINYRKDGSEFVNQWDVHPMTDDEGHITHWVSYQHDITERKRAEEVVVDTKIEFDKLRKHAASTFIDADADGTILSVNKSFRQLTGYRKDELEGKKMWSFFPKKYRDSLKARFDDFKEDDFHNQSFRGIIFHKEGFPIQVEGATKVLKLQEGLLIRADIKNISLQKRIMKMLQKRNKSYRNIVQRVSEFTYLVSYDNDTPEVEYVSDEFEQITGVPKEQVLQAGGLTKFVYEKDVEKVSAFLKEVKKRKSGTCEYRIKINNEGYKSVIDSAKRVNRKEMDDKLCISGAVSLVENTVFDMNDIEKRL